MQAIKRAGSAGRPGRRGVVPDQRRRRLHHRADAERGWRQGAVVADIRAAYSLTTGNDRRALFTAATSPYSPMRRWLRPLWVVLALLFLLEAWLWDHLEPIVARVVNLIPWGRLKDWLARLIDELPPWAALFVFIIPFIVMLPLKFLEVYFLATGNWLGAVASSDPGQAARPRPHRLHLRRDARQAAADGVVPPDVRLVPVGARLGARANRADAATAAAIDLAVETAARRTNSCAG